MFYQTHGEHSVPKELITELSLLETLEINKATKIISEKRYKIPQKAFCQETSLAIFVVTICCAQSGMQTGNLCK